MNAPPAMLTVYATKQENGSVAIFRDAKKTNPFCTFSAWQSDRPTKRNRYITLNCYRWRLAWIA